MAAYLDCGERDLSLPADGPQTFVRPNLLAILGVTLERPVTGPQINIVRGEPFTFAQQAAERPFATALADERQIDLDVSGLDPKKRYGMGVSWWDYDGKGRMESVSIQGAGKTNDLIQNKFLPAFATLSSPNAKAGQMPEEWCVELPAAPVYTNLAPNSIGMTLGFQMYSHSDQGPSPLGSMPPQLQLLC